MNTGFFFLAFFLLMIVVQVIIYLGKQAEARKLQEAAQKTAVKLGLTASTDDDIPDTVLGFRLLREGYWYTRQFGNYFRGHTPFADFQIFDYIYTDRTQDIRNTLFGWRQTVIVFTLPEAFFPPFLLQPRSLTSTIAFTFNLTKISFPSHPVFTRKYSVHSSEPEAIYTLFTPEALSALQLYTARSIEARGRYFLYTQKHQAIHPDFLADFIAEAQEILSLFYPPKETLAPDKIILLP